MKTINLNLKKDKKYVVACSFGPDSMALLDVAIKNGFQIVVAHVNYRKREAAVYEQESLMKYCNDRKIHCYVLDLIDEIPVGNFQDWARKRRYEFFKQICQKEGTDTVLVAHQQDDVIETYLMQKKRRNISKYAGIPVENEIFGIRVVRPLLSFSKQELKDYDDENKVPYSIDESNLTDHYTRNKIRHNIVEKMSNEERTNIIREIENKQVLSVEFKTIFSKEEFLNLTNEQVVRLLDVYMSKLNEHKDISSKYINEIKKAFIAKTNARFKISDSLLLEQDYGTVYLVNLRKIKAYKFVFKNRFTNEFLDIDFTNGAEDRKIAPNLKEFVVRNVDKKGTYLIKDYSTKISRLFIDWKMPHFLREIWPAVFDEKGLILYIPRYREKFVEKHKSKFVINTEYFTEF